MARASKPQFVIHEDADAGMPDPPTDHKHSCPPCADNARSAKLSLDHEDNNSRQYETSNRHGTWEEVADDISYANIMPTDIELDDRRGSAVTSTSISSLPESSFDTDQEFSMPLPYLNTRPSFRKPESAQRLQMSSPSPFEKSPRRSILHTRSRSGTPRSVRVSAKGSPLSRRRWVEDETMEEKKEYPLVLLHVTLLPVKTRWSLESMYDILPLPVMENLQFLQSKASETVVQRGILIPHPGAEYELLEERLLEALELKEERITRCGHFRARDSTSSASSAEGSVGSTDSGLGSSVGGGECNTCHRRLKSVGTPAGKGLQKWSIKVFAANGLMRASAWAAAWSEMERVDVEILPWIAEDLRKQLDARTMEAEAELRRDEEEAHIRAVVEEQVKIAHEHLKRVEEEEKRRYEQELEERQIFGNDDEPQPEASRTVDTSSTPKVIPGTRHELPHVYQPKDIPLSLLLENYIILLARDKRNVLGGLCTLLAMCLLSYVALAPVAEQLSPLPQAPGTLGPEYSIVSDTGANMFNAATQGDMARTIFSIVEPADLPPSAWKCDNPASPEFIFGSHAC